MHTCSRQVNALSGSQRAVGKSTHVDFVDIDSDSRRALHVFYVTCLECKGRRAREPRGPLGASAGRYVHSAEGGTEEIKNSVLFGYILDGQAQVEPYLPSCLS